MRLRKAEIHITVAYATDIFLGSSKKTGLAFFLKIFQTLILIKLPCFEVCNEGEHKRTVDEQKKCY